MDNSEPPHNIRFGDENALTALSKRRGSNNASKQSDTIIDVYRAATYSLWGTRSNVYVQELQYVLRQGDISIPPKVQKSLNALLETLDNLDECMAVQHTHDIIALLHEHNILTPEHIAFMKACLHEQYKISVAIQDEECVSGIVVASCTQCTPALLEALEKTVHSWRKHGYIDTDSLISFYRETGYDEDSDNDDDDNHNTTSSSAGIAHGTMDDDELEDDSMEDNNALEPEYNDIASIYSKTDEEIFNNTETVAEDSEQEDSEENSAYTELDNAKKELDHFFCMLSSLKINTVVLGIDPDRLAPYIELLTDVQTEDGTLIYAIESNMDMRTGFPLLKKLSEGQTFTELFEHYLSLDEKLCINIIEAGLLP